jgi:hypothetical protein
MISVEQYMECGVRLVALRIDTDRCDQDQIARRSSTPGTCSRPLAACAVQEFDRHAREIQADLGGFDQLSAIERSLVEAFVVCPTGIKDR